MFKSSHICLQKALGQEVEDKCNLLPVCDHVMKQDSYSIDKYVIVQFTAFPNVTSSSIAYLSPCIEVIVGLRRVHFRQEEPGLLRQNIREVVLQNDRPVSPLKTSYRL